MTVCPESVTEGCFWDVESMMAQGGPGCNQKRYRLNMKKVYATNSREKIWK